MTDNEGKVSGEQSPEHLKEKIDRWLAEGGQQELVDTMKDAEEESDSFRLSIQPDLDLLNKPVTL